MSKSLPARPNLDHLRKQSRQLLTALRAGKPDAVRTFIEHLPAAKRMTADRVRRAGFRLADAQWAIARKSGFSAWPGLARHVERLRAFEGEWRFVSLEIDGAPVPPGGDASRLLIDGDRFRMESPGGLFEGIFTIDVEATPERIDIEFVEGPEAGNWSYGIYTQDEDDLVFCLGLGGASRPESFATRAGSGHALERLRRVSAARPAGVRGGRRTRSALPPPPDAAVARPAGQPVKIDEAAFAVEMTPLLARLQGQWIPIALVNDGRALEPSLLSYGRRTLEGNETKVIFGGQIMVHAKIRIDESQSPISIDYLNIGRGPKTVTRGILEVAGETVRFCMAAAGAARPTAFTSEPGSARLLSEWKRE